ncbi:MAG: FecR domain-containing protein [Desulfobacterales bacterium]|nr:FecR domain-containing protein [Desulfobacterales bacterium]
MRHPVMLFSPPLFLALCFLVFSAAAGPAVSAEIGQIKNLSNSVHILRNNTKIPAVAGELLHRDDTVLTGEDSKVGITFIDNSRFSLGADSQVELSRFKFNPTTQEGQFHTTVKKGTLVVVSGKIAKFSPDAMKVRTRTSMISVRGTKFMVKVTDSD